MTELGFLIETSTHYGTEYLHCRLIERNEKGQIRNPLDDRYTDGHPMAFENFEIAGHFAVMSDGPTLIGFMPQFSPYRVDTESQCRRMLKTLERCRKQTDKDRAGDPGDVFLAIARAVGATFALTQVGRSTGTQNYDDLQFSTWTIPEGRDLVRRRVNETCAAMQPRRA